MEIVIASAKGGKSEDALARVNLVSDSRATVVRGLARTQ